MFVSEEEKNSINFHQIKMLNAHNAMEWSKRWITLTVVYESENLYKTFSRYF